MMTMMSVTGCPIIAAFMKRWNAAELTEIIVPFEAKEDKEIEDRRAFMAMDWIVRTFIPEWLGMCNERYAKHAGVLRSLPEIMTLEGLIAATPILVDAQREAVEAWPAMNAATLSGAFYSAWAAARSATWDVAALSEAWNMALTATWDVALAAAWDVPKVAIAPVEEKLQFSAVSLVKRMCKIRRDFYS